MVRYSNTAQKRVKCCYRTRMKRRESYEQGWIPNQNLTGTPSPPLPSPPLPLEVGPLNPARGSGGAL